MRQIVGNFRTAQIQGGKSPVTAVNGIDLHVRAGLIHGLLGPNRARRTTTISIATIRVVVTAGPVRRAGADVVADPARPEAMIMATLAR